MARSIDWDAVNRQNRLKKWIRDHGTYDWLDSQPNLNSEELDKWAKREVRKSVSRVSRKIDQEIKAKNSVQGKTIATLNEIQVALESDNESAAVERCEHLLNLIIKSHITDIDAITRRQLIEVIGLLFAVVSAEN